MPYPVEDPPSTESCALQGVPTPSLVHSHSLNRRRTGSVCQPVGSVGVIPLWVLETQGWLGWLQ